MLLEPNDPTLACVALTELTVPLTYLTVPVATDRGERSRA
jgi:hypothetical protein